MVTRSATLAFLLGTFLSTAAGAQTISLDGALAEAEAHAPSLDVIRARLGIADADIGIARLLPNPRLSVGTTLASARLTAGLNFSFPLFGQREASIRAATAQSDVSRKASDVARVDVRLATALAWCDLWLSQREAEASALADARRRQLVPLTEERYKTGTAPRLDVVRVRAEAARARAESASAAKLVSAAAAQLAVWLGRDPAASLGLRAEGDLRDFPPSPTREAMHQRVEHHPSFSEARAAEVATETNVRLKRRLRWPYIGLQVGGNVLARQDPFNDLLLALNFEVPTFHVYGPVVRRAEAEQRTANAQLVMTQRMLAADAEVAVASLEAATERARMQRDEALPAAEEAAEMAVEAYRAGMADITAVLAAEQALSDARLATARALADRQRAWAALERAAGGSL